MSYFFFFSCKQQSRETTAVCIITQQHTVYIRTLIMSSHSCIHSFTARFSLEQSKIKSCCSSLWRNNTDCMCSLYPDTHTVHHKYSTVIYALVQLKRGKKEAVGGQWGLRILDLWPLLWFTYVAAMFLDLFAALQRLRRLLRSPFFCIQQQPPSLKEKPQAVVFFFKYNYTLQYVHCVIIVSHAAVLYSRCVFAKEEPNKIRRNLPAFFFFRREATSEHSFCMV